MAVCVYDNPNTFFREVWQDGKLVCAYSAHLLLRKLAAWETQPIPGDKLHFGANIGNWREGQLIGDASAVRSSPPDGSSRASTADGSLVQ